MTGKKITNVSTKIRNNYHNTTNQQQPVSTGKNLTKNATQTTGAYINTIGNAIRAIPTDIPATTSIQNQQPNLSTLIKIQDNSRFLPRYSIALTKPIDESYPAEELDAVQLELELLLSTAALRYRSLKNGFDSLDREDKNHKKNDKHAITLNTTGKRKRDDGVKKSNKETKNQQTKLSKLKTYHSSGSPAHSQHTDDSMDAIPQQTNQTVTSQPNPKILIPKNDIPNKFWLSVEPYCMPITQEDIKLLDDLIEEYSGDLIPPIPELGTHYSTRWASEDLRDEQDNSNQNAKANKRFANATNNEVNSILKKGGKLLGEGVTGPLTQRLVAALLEENLLQGDIIGSSDGTSALNNESNDSCGENNSSSANRSAMPVTSLLKNGIDVEKRLKNELIELGILDVNDFPKEKDDEVLSEIKRVRTELKSISEYNLNELNQLKKAAKQEIKRLEIKRKLDLVDQEVCNYCIFFCSNCLF